MAVKELTSPLPELIVFDLDWTLWPLDVDCQTMPFRAAPGGGGTAIDADGARLAPFPDTPAILASLFDAGLRVAFASRTHDAAAAEALLRLLPLPARGSAGSGSAGGGGGLCLWDLLRGERGLFQAYPSRGARAKEAHFAALREASGVEPQQWLFFDDLSENTRVALAGGVAAVELDRQGLTWARWEEGLALWRRRQAAGGGAGAR